jgi:hypothetical protein
MNDDDDDDEGGDDFTPIKKVARDLLSPLERVNRGASRSSEPTWLLAANKLKKYPPKIEFQDLSIHIMNHGHGPCSVITIREIDAETDHKKGSKVPEDIFSLSKRGVLGRILTGVRIKILEVWQDR